MFETDKIKKRGHYIPSLFYWNCQEIQGFSFKKKEKKKKSSPSGSSFQVKFIWSSNEAHLILGRMYLKLRRDVSGAASGRICYCVGTYQMLRRDAISGTALEIIREKTASKTPLKITKNAWVSLFLWQYMADYGN